MAKAATTPGTEVTFDNAPKIDDDTLRGLNSFADVIELAQTKLGAEIISASDVIGDGLTVLNGDDKTQLIGLDCVFITWEFHLGDQGPFVSAIVVAKGAGGVMLKTRVNDGSTGIYAQLHDFTAKTNRQSMLRVAKGLRASRYFFEEGTGTIYKEGGPGRKSATTFYLDTSA